MSARTELIVALDFPHIDDVLPIIDGLPPALRWYKIGLELFCAEGPRAVALLHERGCRIFLDLKLHDIPRTVERAVRAAASHGIGMLTIHADGGRTMLRAAADAAHAFGPQAPKIIAVTVLTSLTDADLEGMGVRRSTADHVLALADLALSAGVDGLVCSPLEVRALRARFGKNPLLVTPGIRATGEDAGDQQRTATAADAARAGSNYLVVGRPVLQAKDPHAAAVRLLEEIALGAMA